MSLNLRRILVVSLPFLNAAQNATTATMQMTEAVADVFKNQRLTLMLITSSCVLLAIIIIWVGVCFYKKYGGSHYGSGQIRILSEDGSVGEEVMYVFQTNGKVRRESATEARKSRGKSLGLFYADHQGNILSAPHDGRMDRSLTPKAMSTGSSVTPIVKDSAQELDTSSSDEAISHISTDSAIVVP